MSSTRITSRLFELIHLDISENGNSSLSGAIYTVAFLDDFTATASIMLLKANLELLQELSDYKNRVELVQKFDAFVILNIRQDGPILQDE